MNFSHCLSVDCWENERNNLARTELNRAEQSSITLRFTLRMQYEIKLYYLHKADTLKSVWALTSFLLYNPPPHPTPASSSHIVCVGAMQKTTSLTQSISKVRVESYTQTTLSLITQKPTLIILNSTFHFFFALPLSDFDSSFRFSLWHSEIEIILNFKLVNSSCIWWGSCSSTFLLL